MAEDRDSILVGRVLTGDSEAYRGIVDRHKARIYYLGLKFFHGPEDAEDFAQDVFLKAYDKLSTFRGGSPFSAWLYRLAFNLAVNRYHVVKKRLTTVQLDEVSDEQAQPERELIRKEERETVVRLMRELPDVYNVVLKMHYYDDLTYKEISRAMGIPVNTVKSHVHRAKKMLAERWSRHG